MPALLPRHVWVVPRVTLLVMLLLGSIVLPLPSAEARHRPLGEVQPFLGAPLDFQDHQLSFNQASYLDGTACDGGSVQILEGAYRGKDLIRYTGTDQGDGCAEVVVRLPRDQKMQAIGFTTSTRSASIDPDDVGFHFVLYDGARVVATASNATLGELHVNHNVVVPPDIEAPAVGLRFFDGASKEAPEATIGPPSLWVQERWYPVQDVRAEAIRSAAPKDGTPRTYWMDLQIDETLRQDLAAGRRSMVLHTYGQEAYHDIDMWDDHLDGPGIEAPYTLGINAERECVNPRYEWPLCAFITLWPEAFAEGAAGTWTLSFQTTTAPRFAAPDGSTIEVLPQVDPTGTPIVVAYVLVTVPALAFLLGAANMARARVVHGRLRTRGRSLVSTTSGTGVLATAASATILFAFDGARRTLVTPPFGRVVVAYTLSALALTVLLIAFVAFEVNRRRAVVQDTKRQQHALKRAQDQSSEAKRRAEELDTLMHAVTHDLKTPLITMNWLAEDLEASLKEADPADVEANLTRMRRSVGGMEGLVHELLDLSRLAQGQAVERRPTELGPIVEDVVAELAEPSRRADMHVKTPGPWPTVYADPARLKQVLRNLVGNAIKYGRPGGQVIVGARHHAKLRRDELWVDDDGPGVPIDERPILFEPFRRGTTSGDAEGTGLGLALVERIVRAHGGRIDIRDSPLGGARFFVSLPAQQSSD